MKYEGWKLSLFYNELNSSVLPCWAAASRTETTKEKDIRFQS